MIERIIPENQFIANDTELNGTNDQIMIITGPNMAGKSTYLRQVALITLMAQVGSFVPADSAHISIVDRIFSRVGAQDHLQKGMSTFMVEMNETANILNNATERSLIILDEIGRGTSTFDGISIAWSIVEYLHGDDIKGGPKTLFATHYHELTDLEASLERLENHHVEVKEFGDKIIFLRTIADGPGDKSYGIHVAKMAGLPASIVSRAWEILQHHIQNEKNKDGTSLPIESSERISLFHEQESRLRKDLNELDIDSITPLEALTKLGEIKKEYDL